MVVANVGGQNEFYSNDGSGLGWTRSSLGDQAQITYGVAAGDLDGDGFVDLGFANSAGQNLIFLNLGTASRRE